MVSTQKNTLTHDLLEAQKKIEAVDKDGKNPFFKSEYTTLNATIQACKEILNAHNIVVLQPVSSDENGVYVCTTLLHTSGERIESKMRITLSKGNDPQAQGSAITYARRYSLKSLLCMSDEDDDGEKAMVRQPAATHEPDHIEKQLIQAPCRRCGGEQVLNPKTGKIFCKAKCWLQPTQPSKEYDNESFYPENMK